LLIIGSFVLGVVELLDSFCVFFVRNIISLNSFKGKFLNGVFGSFQGEESRRYGGEREEGEGE
jgi:hypothetical protein